MATAPDTSVRISEAITIQGDKVTSELLRAYTARSQSHSVFAIGPFSNPWMVRATVASFVLLLLVIYVPALQAVFGTLPLALSDWLLMLPLFFLLPTAAELCKAFLRRRPS